MSRTISEIASEIRSEWPKVNYAAEPYLRAMQELGSVSDSYGYDSGREIVLRFVCNASSFRGEAARRIKKELRELCAES